jgi:hypothetical protein
MSYILGSLTAYLLDPVLWLGSYLGAKFAPKDRLIKKFFISLVAGLVTSILIALTLGNNFNPIRVIAAFVAAAICTKLVNSKKQDANLDMHTDKDSQER